MNMRVLLGTGALLSLSIAIAPCAVARPEPNHVALIIGNSKYALGPDQTAGPDELILPPLPNACNDTNVVAASLVTNANWKDSEITTACDLDVPDMVKLIRHFAKQMRKPGSVGLLYFSGHGLQIGDHNYLFGIHAHPDVVTEAYTYLSNPNAPLFPDDAIDLHEDIVREVGNVNNGALLVVVDACRDNPLQSKILEVLNRLNTSGQHFAVSAPSTSTNTVPGIKIAYSTSNGDTASDGLGASSPYAESFAAHIASRKEITNILGETETDVYNSTLLKFPAHPQNPSETGHFSQPPIWCFSSCPDDEEKGKRNSTELIKAKALFRVAAFTVPESRKLQVKTYSPQKPTNEHVPADFTVLEPTHFRARGYSSVDFDIYWCMGGSGEAARRSKAEKLAQQIAHASPQTPHGSEFIGRVKLRPLSVQANSTVDNRFEKDVGAPGHSVLAAELLSKYAPSLEETKETPTSTVPGLANVYVCGRDQHDRSGRIYMQFPDLPGAADVAAQVEEQVKSRFADLDFVGGERGMERRPLGTSPEKTEVRFYRYEDQLAAFDAAHALEEFFHKPVLIKYVPRLAKQAGKKLPLEIWLGETEPALQPQT